MCPCIKSRTLCWSITLLMTVILAAAVAVLVVQPWARHGGQTRARRFESAAVAANGYECASIGRSILKKKGSAVDAAIATLFCEGLGCAQCMGLGGGFMATVYDGNTKQVRVLNARERAPAATTPNMFDNASSTVGGLAIAVPGELRGYGALHKKYGRLDWAELVRPTANLCRTCHEVTEYMGRVLATYSKEIKMEPSLWEVYGNPATGEVYKVGDRIVRPTLARTLDIIAKEGPEAMHNGSLTARLVRDIKEFGGIITEEDMRNYRVEWKDPIVTELSEHHTLYSAPLPGSGAVLAFILNMVNGWACGTTANITSGLYWHRVIETFKYAYAIRTALGDPSRQTLGPKIAQLERNLSSPEWAKSFRYLVNDNRTYNDWKHYGAFFKGVEDHGTGHVVVMASDGSAVSVTSTINHIWGSQRRSRSLGILLNNQMNDFAIPKPKSYQGMPPSPANMPGPNLQPLSSMAPSILLFKNGDCDLVIGAAGGAKITTQVSLGVIHIVLEHQYLSDVITWPRLHHQLIPMEVQYEKEFDPEIIKSLERKGHRTNKMERSSYFATMIGAQREEFSGSSYLIPDTDPRRRGSIDGY